MQNREDSDKTTLTLTEKLAKLKTAFDSMTATREEKEQIRLELTKLNLSAQNAEEKNQILAFLAADVALRDFFYQQQEQHSVSETQREIKKEIIKSNQSFPDLPPVPSNKLTSTQDLQKTTSPKEWARQCLDIISAYQQEFSEEADIIGLGVELAELLQMTYEHENGDIEIFPYSPALGESESTEISEISEITEFVFSMVSETADQKPTVTDAQLFFKKCVEDIPDLMPSLKEVALFDLEEDEKIKKDPAKLKELAVPAISLVTVVAPISSPPEDIFKTDPVIVERVIDKLEHEIKRLDNKYEHKNQDSKAYKLYLSRRNMIRNELNHLEEKSNEETPISYPDLKKELKALEKNMISTGLQHKFSSGKIIIKAIRKKVETAEKQEKIMFKK